MTASYVFSIANPFALMGWLILIFAIWRRNNWLRDVVAARIFPLLLSALYAVIILLFFGQAQGGFDTLANVKMLFTSDWAALAGWVHYLAFDLFVGSWIAREVMALGLSRLWLIPLLPLTFMFGPMGFLAFEAVKLATRSAPSISGQST
jgi:Domain of unknown function (DUF4281)